MLRDFISYIEENKLIAAGSRTLLAVSGGVDSVVMTDLFFHAGLAFDLAHCNFQLRGNESERDEQFVRSLAGKYQVNVFVKHFDTERFAGENKISIQLAARQLRYDWFNELTIQQGFSAMATAHHLDDQVETFLINLSRGATGLAGLHGILPKQGKIIRPLMFAGRKEIKTYALENKMDFVEDSSNNSVKYTRNRIRHKIIPQLEKLNPSFRKAICDTIGHIREVEMIYRQAVGQKKREILVARGDQIYIPAKQFFSLVPLRTWAYELLAPYGFNHANIHDITAMADAFPGKEVLSPTHRAIRDRENIIISPRKESDIENIVSVTADDLSHKIIKYPIQLGFEILCECPSEFDDPAYSAFLDLEKLSFPLHLRKWRRGDFFYPMGMSQRKKLSDFFIDQKFSLLDKEKQWIMCSGGDIVWIVGQRIDDRFKISTSSKKILKITLFTDG